MPRGGGGVLPYKDSMGMCHVKAPYFSALATHKDSTFSTWATPKDPFSKTYNSLFLFSNLGRSKKTHVLKKYVCYF